MSITQHAKVLILGSGPRVHRRRLRCACQPEPVLITGMAQGGQLMTTTEVDNWPADVHGVQGPDLMQRFLEHAERFKTQIIFDHINKVDFSKRPFTSPATAAPTPATPSSSPPAHRPNTWACPRKRPSWAGRVGLRHLRRFLLPRPGRVRGRRRQHAAVEEALYLSNIARKVTLVHRRDKFKAEPIWWTS